jgi:hypothetical protein
MGTSEYEPVELARRMSLDKAAVEVALGEKSSFSHLNAF